MEEEENQKSLLHVCIPNLRDYVMPNYLLVTGLGASDNDKPDYYPHKAYFTEIRLKIINKK